MFSTVVLSNFFKIGMALGNQNIGLFLYVLCRDVIIACIYGRCVTLLMEFRLKKIVYYGILAFYAITPVWASYAKHAFKDTFATALFCLYMIYLVLSIWKIKLKSFQWKDACIYGVTAFLPTLFRNNFIYVIGPVTLLLLMFMLVQKVRWQQMIVIVCLLSLYWGYNWYIFNIQDVQQGSGKEALSIVLQQTARTVRDHKEDLEREDLEAIGGIFDVEVMGEMYNPILSDPIKDNVRFQSRQDAVRYMKNYFHLLTRFPLSYLEAAIAQSYGYYVFVPRQAEHAGNWNSGMTYFNWLGGYGAFHSEFFDLSYVKKTEVVRDVLANWADIWDNLPLLSLTDTCAFYTWFIVLSGIYLICRKRFCELIAIVALLLMVVTCIASPVNDCFRYFSPVAAAAPLVLLLLQEWKCEDVELDKKIY